MAVRKRWIVLAVVLGVPAVAVLVWGIYRIKDHQMRTKRGSATAAFITEQVLVLVDQLASMDTRVTSVDLASGEPTVRWWHTGFPESCEPRASRMMFCSIEGGVLLDAATLDERGRTKASRPMDRGCDKHSSAGGARTERAGEVVFGQSAPGPSYAPVAESTTPVVRVKVPGVQDLIGTTPQGVFAYASINRQYALSYVLATGKLAWTVPISGDCNAFAVVGDTVVLATDTWPDRALAIDLATGAVRWRVP